MQDSSNDYSILLQSVEDGISRSGGLSGSVMKRRRAASNDDDDDGVAHSDRLSIADSRRLVAEVDRLKLVTEEYMTKLNIEKDSREREKARYLRQLEFLEAECLDLKKSLSQQTDKYYEDKRTWQRTLRDVEERHQSGAIAAASVPSNPSSSKLVVATSGGKSRDEGWEARLASLESSIDKKAAEVVSVKSANAQLEAENSKLHQLVRSMTEEQKRSEGAATEDETGKRQRALLESTIREKNRTIERLERRAEQIAQLQQENIALQSKLSAALERGSAVMELQAKLQQLTNEREEWMVLFRHSIKQAKAFSANADLSLDSRAADSHIPMQVLRLLKKTQETVAVSSSQLAIAQTELIAVRRRLTQSEDNERSLEEALQDAKSKLDKNDSQSSLFKRQTILFEKEVISLRELLKSFDAEFCIGKPKETASMFKAKDDLIETLREQLDTVRAEARLSLEEMHTLKESLRSAPMAEAPCNVVLAVAAAATPSSTATVAALKEEVEKLRFRLREFQRAVGKDHIESETRVLHLIANPTNNFTGSSGQNDRLLHTSDKGSQRKCAAESEYDSLSIASITSEIRQLKEENMRLREAIIMKTEKDSRINTTVACDGNVSVNRSAVDSDKLNMRLKAMFRERISCFREAVYLLTGYKVDLFSTDSYNGSHPRLKLRSMYAEDPEDCLIFQWKGESLELLETPYAATIDPKIFSFLTSCHSVPAFLSNITLELFEKQTFLG